MGDIFFSWLGTSGCFKPVKYYSSNFLWAIPANTGELRTNRKGIDIDRNRK